MPKIIKLTNQDGKVLSKEQKAFNNYIKNIKAEKEAIEHLKEVNHWLLGKGESIVAPAERKLIEAQKQMLLALDASPFIDKLSKKLRERFEMIMYEGLSLLVLEANQEDLVPLFNKYSDTSYEEQKDASLDMINSMMGQMFGIDLEVTQEELENPALLQERMAKIMEEKEAEEAEKRANRKRTQKQIEKEEKAKEAEKKLTQTSKKIYLELVKNFHPDQEQDEAEREKKTAILQEANAAYQNDDFLGLLELQIRLFEEKEDALSKTSDETLKYYNKILKEQLTEMRYEAKMLHPELNGHPYGKYYHATQSWRSEKKMKEAAKEKLETIKIFEANIRDITSLQGFKSFVQEFYVESENADMSDLLSFLLK